MAVEFKMYHQLSDDEMTALYRAAEDENLFDWVCHDWPMTEAVFGLMARRAEVFAGIYDERGRPLGFFYLTDFRGLSAYVHMCFFERGRSRRHEAGRAGLKWCFETFELRCLIGLVPVINRAAVWYAGELDGKRLGEIPGGCWMERLRKTVDGVIFIFERKD